MGRGGAKKSLLGAIALLIVSLSFVGAEVHHVVGGDRGWDPSSNVASWSSGRVFRVGDKLWFAFSAAQESVVELKTREEYESCDLKNPIKMYTDGLDGVPLYKEGIRYFASRNEASCKKGLKLPVPVVPEGYMVSEIQSIATSEGGGSLAVEALAAGPSSPATRVGGSSAWFGFGLLVCFIYMGIM